MFLMPLMYAIIYTYISVHNQLNRFPIVPLLWVLSENKANIYLRLRYVIQRVINSDHDLMHHKRLVLYHCRNLDPTIRDICYKNYMEELLVIPSRINGSKFS